MPLFPLSQLCADKPSPTTAVNKSSSPSVSDFKNNPAALLAAIDEFSLNEEFLISVGPQKAGVLSKIIEENKPRVLVELGGYLGYSAILFAAAMKKANGSGKESDFNFPQHFFKHNLTDA